MTLEPTQWKYFGKSNLNYIIDMRFAVFANLFVLSNRGGLPVPPPTPIITRMEDGLTKAGNSLPAKMDQVRLDGKIVLPLRPGYGTLGKAIVVYANYFQIFAKEKLQIHKYNVTIGGNAQPSQLRRKRIISLLIEDLDLQIPYRTNFRDILCTTAPIPNIRTSVQKKVTYRADGEDEPKPNPVVYEVTLTYDDHFVVADLLAYLDPSNANIPAPADTEKVVQAFNAIFNHGPYDRDGIAAVISKTGLNKYFSMAHNKDGSGTFTALGNGIEAMRGFIKSVRLGTGRLLLNVNVTSGVFVQPCRLDKLMDRFNATGYQLEKKLKRLHVMRTHLKPKKSKNGREFPSMATIWGLANKSDGASLEHPPQVVTFGGPKQVSFWLRPQGSSSLGSKLEKSKKSPAATSGGRYITVYDYFMKGMFRIIWNKQ